MDKEIIKNKVDEFLEDPVFREHLNHNAAYALAQHIADFVEQENRNNSASIIANARVYPTINNRPRPCVSIYGHGLSFVPIVTSWMLLEEIGLKDDDEVWKQLEEIGLKDDDEVIITVKKA